MNATISKPKRPLEDWDGYQAWLKTLSADEYEKECRRTYRHTEYLLNLLGEEDDVLEIVDVFSHRSEAESEFFSYELPEGAIGLELEKCVTTFKAIDFDTLDKDYTQIRIRRY